MCGIAGHHRPDGQAAARSRRRCSAWPIRLWHRGPDEDGFLVRPGLGFASRRLSIVGLGDGRQPIFNEDGTVAVVYNGELFDYPERKAELRSQGPRLPHPHRHRDHRAPLRGVRRGRVRRAQGPVRAGARRLQEAHDLSRARPRRHLPAALVAAGRLALLRLGDQGAASPRAACRRRVDPRGLDHLFTFFAMSYAAHDVSKACSRCCPATTCKIAFRARRQAVPRSSSAATGTSTSPMPARRRIRPTPSDWSTSSRRNSAAPSRSACAPTCRSSATSPAASIPPTCWPRPRACAAARSPASPSRCPGKGLDETSDALVTARHIGSLPTILTQRRQGHRRHLRQADRLRRLPGHRHVVCRAVVPVAGGAPPGLQGGADRRGLGRGLRRLRLVQAAPAHLLDGRRPAWKGSDWLNRIIRRRMSPHASIERAAAHRRHRRARARAGAALSPRGAVAGPLFQRAT